MVQTEAGGGAWRDERGRRFEAWRAANPDVEAKVAKLKAETAALAAARKAERDGLWERRLAAAAERSAGLDAAQRARVAEQVGEAQRLAAAGDGEGAAALFARVLEADPANIDANFGLGAALQKKGDLAGAAERYAVAASFPKPGTDNGYFRTMMMMQKLPPPPDPTLVEPPVIFRVDGAPKEIWDAPLAPVMTVIPGGEYTMGSLETEPDRDPCETPHRVTIGYPLAVGRGDVTRGEFAAFVAATGYDAESARDSQAFINGGFALDPEASWRNPGFEQTDDEPVVCVSYYDGAAYADWLTRTTGHRYRIPSEAEWEYAVRGGTASSYPWGEALGLGNAHCDGGSEGPPLHKPVPAGTFPPNGFGLYDVVGNVWKWLEDAWNPSYVGAPSDGSAWREGVTVLRGRRGGSWFNVSEARPGDFRAPNRLRSAARFGSLPHLRFSSFGFRVVRDL
jgi:formylglycine-generating enzyme required for sulfatase activity